MSPTARPSGVPELKDGQALDRLTERVERWATSYKHLDDPARWDTDFQTKFEPDASDLARRATAEARPFAGRDWVLAIALWGVIGGIVWIFSTFVMALDGTWRVVFAIFAALLAAVGIWQSYLEVTSEKRVADKLAKKEQWLLGVTRKVANRILGERAAAKGIAP